MYASRASSTFDSPTWQRDKVYGFADHAGFQLQQDIALTFGGTPLLSGAELSVVCRVSAWRWSGATEPANRPC